MNFHHTRVAILVFCAVTACGDKYQAQQEQSLAHIRMYVAGEYGRPLPYRVHEFYNKTLRRGFDEHFKHGLEATNIPFGRYKYTLIRKDSKAPRFSDIQGELEVRYPEQWLTVRPMDHVGVLADGEEFIENRDQPPSQPLNGEFLELPGLSGARWVALQRFDTGHTLEVPIVGSRFLFPEVFPGWHTFLLVHDGRILQADPILVRQESPPRKLTLRFRKDREQTER